LYGIGAEIFAFIADADADADADAAAKAIPATDRRGAPIGQPDRRPVRAVLTLYGIGAEIFAFAADAAAGAMPATGRGAACYRFGQARGPGRFPSAADPR
jgi:hypothetical protein